MTTHATILDALLARAHALGLQAEPDFETIIRRYIDDCRRDNPQALKGMDA